jgi:hypothetical protein
MYNHFCAAHCQSEDFFLNVFCTFQSTAHPNKNWNWTLHYDSNCRYMLIQTPTMELQTISISPQLWNSSTISIPAPEYLHPNRAIAYFCCCDNYFLRYAVRNAFIYIVIVLHFAATVIILVVCCAKYAFPVYT